MRSSQLLLPVLPTLLAVVFNVDSTQTGCSAGWRPWAGRCWTITNDHVTSEDALYVCRKLRQDSHVARVDDHDVTEAIWELTRFSSSVSPPFWTASLYGICMVLNENQMAEKRPCEEKHRVLCSTSEIPDKQLLDSQSNNRRTERSIGHEELRDNITTSLESLDQRSRRPISDLQKNLTETRLYAESTLNDLSTYMANTELQESDCRDLLRAVGILGHIVAVASNGTNAKFGHHRLSIRVLDSTTARGHTWSAYHATAASYSTTSVSRALTSKVTGVRAVVLYSAAVVPSWSSASSPCPAINSSSVLVSDVVGALFVDGRLLRKDVDSAPLLRVTLSHRAARILQLPTCAYLLNTNGTRTWHSEGCTLTAASDTVAKCICPSGEAMAVFMVNQEAIGMLCWISCGITAVACLSTSLAIIGYRLMRSERSYVRMSFLTSLGSAEVAFLAGLRWMHVPGVCTMFAVWLHYSILAAFTWLLAYVLFLGNEMREEADKEQRLNLHMYTLVGWVIPACVVTITLVWRHADYRGRFYCWVNTDNNIHYTLIGPATLFALLAAIILVHVAKRYMFNSVEKQRKYVMALTWTGIRSCIVILPAMTVTWFLATFVVKHRSLSLQILFSMANTLLGLAIIFFMCFINTEIHRARRSKGFGPQRVIRKVFDRFSRGGDTEGSKFTRSALWPWRRRTRTEWAEEVEVQEVEPQVVATADEEEEESDDCSPMKKSTPETAALTKHAGKPDRSPSPMRLFSADDMDYIDTSSMDEFLDSRSDRASRDSRDQHSEISVHMGGTTSDRNMRTITADVEQSDMETEARV